MSTSWSTHLRYDHGGWNTRPDGEGWQPTFPNATYLIPRADKDWFDPRTAHRRSVDPGRLRGQLVYADSVTPVLDRAVLWEDSYRIDGNLVLESAPGHTPGSSLLRLTSGTDRAVFVGDLLHSAVQILAPAHSSCFCEDPESAAALDSAF
ncbi:MBL fold metallo-hydrolase [Amycolatopsis sp. FDAARGOS 1241]|uniref:MBL fold metallo-hydrolase n=1 Tax=Amycolatopsis sp. FDAARGOS 1241 TaxID=2778070 RepID=UPI00351C6ACE